MTVISDNRLDLLGSRIRISLESAAQHDQARIDSLVDAAMALAEARELFKSNIEFGQWCERANFALDKNERAALVAMGADPEQMREVLQKTGRRSIRMIFEHEWTNRLPNIGITGIEEAPEAEEIVDSRYSNIAKTGIEEIPEAGRRQADMRKQLKEAERQARLRRRAQEQLRWREEEARRIAALNKQMEEETAKTKRIFEEAEKLGIAVEQPKSDPPLTMDEYRQIAKCLHPDRERYVSTDELGEAMKIWTSKKFKLTGEH